MLIAAVLVVGYLLFADTVRHYTHQAVDPHVIRFSHFGTYQDYETWGEVIRAFEVDHPGLRVRQEYVAGWYGMYDTKMRQQILSGTLPHVVLVQYGPFRGIARHFESLDDCLPAGFPAEPPLNELDPIALGCFQVDECQRGLPVCGGNLLIYCNPECFQRAGKHRGHEIPLPDDNWTMSDFRRVAEELTCDLDGDGKVDQFGFWQPRWVYYLPFIWSFGAEVLDETNTQWRLIGPAAEAAMQFYQELRFPHQVSPRPEEVAQMVQDVGFLTGKVAMCVNGPWFQPFLARTRLADTYHVAHIPIGPGGRVTRVTWDGVAMRGGLPEAQRRHAEAFVGFVCSHKAQVILTRTQRALPALRSAAAEFTRGDLGRTSQRFVEALSYSRLQPETPHFRAMDRAINRHLVRLLAEHNRPTAAKMLADLAADPAIVKAFPEGGGDVCE
ncbi:MAG: extracellular solute-binding protein [Phycisphaerae bacterium]|nr:extracellular solute-binding protein [Phycisphaerae bacterium]